jgi:hypothetical protein
VAYGPFAIFFTRSLPCGDAIHTYEQGKEFSANDVTAWPSGLSVAYLGGQSGVAHEQTQACSSHS